MKIEYNDWQNLNLDNFNNNINNTIVGESYLEDFLDDSASLNVTKYSNSALKGTWGNYSFAITGNHFTDNSDTITLKSMSFTSSTETLNIKGDLSANDYSDAISGYFSSIYYANSLTNMSFSFAGRFEDTNLNGTTTFIGNGYQISTTGNFTVTSAGETTAGTVTAFSLTDNAGRKITVSDIAMDYAMLDSLTDSGSSITDLYNTLDFSGNDTITGSNGDDTLDGAGGVDTLIGGKGNDTYIVDLLSNASLQDSIKEAKNAGTDTLALRGNIALGSAVTITLANNFENLDASDTASTLLNLTGNKVANTITGNDADNTIDGGKGADTMAGGDGNDIYMLDVAGDIVTEAANAGTDQVIIKFAGSYALADNIENAVLANGKAFTLTGNALNNALTGGNGANVLNGASGYDTLDGGKGKDTLIGGVGNDSLTGGLGADTFDWSLADIGTSGAPTVDTVQDFSLTQKDVLDFRDLLTSANESDLAGLQNYLDLTTDGTHTEIRISTSGGFTGGSYDAAAEDAHITLANVNLLAGTDEATLLQTLINKNQLLID